MVQEEALLPAVVSARQGIVPVQPCMGSNVYLAVNSL